MKTKKVSTNLGLFTEETATAESVREEAKTESAPTDTESKYKVILSPEDQKRIIEQNMERFEEGLRHFEEVSKIKKINAKRYIYALAVLINNNLDGLPVRDLKPISDWNREGHKVRQGEKMLYADKTVRSFARETGDGAEEDKGEVKYFITYRLFHRSQVVRATAEELEKFNKKRLEHQKKDKTSSKKTKKIKKVINCKQEEEEPLTFRIKYEQFKM